MTLQTRYTDLQSAQRGFTADPASTHFLDDLFGQRIFRTMQLRPDDTGVSCVVATSIIPLFVVWITTQED